MSRRRRGFNPRCESLEKLILLTDLAASSVVGITAFQNNGSGAFTPTTTANGVSQVAGYGDLNGDGLTDIVQVKNDGIDVLLNNGLGTFTNPPANYRVSNPNVVCIAAAVGNFTGHTDGRRDIVVLANNNGGEDFYIFTNQGGSFLQTAFAHFSDAQNSGQNDTGTITVGDFLNNGRDQMVFTTNGSDGGDSGLNFEQVAVGGGATAGSFISLPAGHHAVGATAGDYNKDGNLDLAIEARNDDRPTDPGFITLDLLTGNGTGRFNYTSSLDTPGSLDTGVVGIVHGNFFQEVTAPTAPAVGDSGFEAVPAGSGFVVNPTGSAWTFSSGSGVTGNNSPFTSGNPNAPQGQQVAFVQNTGTITQSVANLAAGNYQISFQAAQRGNYGGFQTLQVLVDGSAVGTITPSGTSYATYTTSIFAVAAGTHTISFVGLTPTTGDSTAFIDNVNLAFAPAATVVDSGFESVSVGSGGGAYVYNPSGSAWTFGPQSGLSGNGSAFTAGSPIAPQGSQVAFLQDHGTISQSIGNFAAGSYQISLLAAQRANYGTSNQSFQVLIDGTVVGTINPTSTSYQSYSTPSFNVTAGTHTLTFQGLTSNASDYTAFIDAVAINQTADNPTPDFQVAVPIVIDSSDGRHLQLQFASVTPTGVWVEGSLIDAGLSDTGNEVTNGNIVAADFNGDGKTDVAFSNGSLLYVLLSDPASNNVLPFVKYDLPTTREDIGVGRFF